MYININNINDVYILCILYIVCKPNSSLCVQNFVNELLFTYYVLILLTSKLWHFCRSGTLFSFSVYFTRFPYQIMNYEEKIHIFHRILIVYIYSYDNTIIYKPEEYFTRLFVTIINVNSKYIT